VILALGGSEQRVTGASGWSVGWSADSKSLLVNDRISPGEPLSGFRVSLESGERTQLTFPPHESFYGDFDFISSPDGTRIAFTREVRPPLAEIFLMPSAGGHPQKVAQSAKYISGLAWTPDSREIVFSSRQSGVNALWRTRLDPPSTPIAIPGVETDAIRPSIPRFGTAERIAYQRVEICYRMWHAVISGNRMSQPQCILPSRRLDSLPQISPDGYSIVFASDRTGSFDIWVSRLDGFGLRDLSAGSGLLCGSPRWSPDGTAIVFDAHREGESYDIYATSASGGPLRQLTREPSAEVRPSWSHDGKWIYFASDRTGDMEIWKMPAAGDGAEVRMTNGGGFEAFESPDGQVLYFVKRGTPSSALWQMPSAGGKEIFLSDAVRDGRWSVAPSGIFFIDTLRRVCKLGAGRQSACIGTIAREGSDSSGLAVSRDGKDIVYVQPEPTRSDLRMAEGRLF
jgi:Tol biopolymer transport system component